MKNTSGLGYLFIIASLFISFFHYFSILSVGQAGLGDINYSIGHFSLAIIWAIFGLTLVISQRLKDLHNKIEK